MKSRKKLFDELERTLAKPDESESSTEGLLDIQFKFPTDRQKLLRQRGVDGYAFEAMSRPYIFEDAVVRITPELQNVPPDQKLKPISTKRQIKLLGSLLRNPLKGSYTAAIGSYPSDSYARIIAMNIMDRAITAQNKGTLRHKAYPLWHTLYGGYYDSLRDSKDDSPISMLILSNVGPDSTPVKLEKLRDLLVKYSHIPKIVIVNGADPVSFFANTVRLPLSHPMYISSLKKSNSILDI
jgi:hypothetical protein